jgi:hypothetical protein
MDDRNVFVSTWDGRRFLVSSLDPADRGESMAVLANWTSSLRAGTRAERLAQLAAGR